MIPHDILGLLPQNFKFSNLEFLGDLYTVRCGILIRSQRTNFHQIRITIGHSMDEIMNKKGFGAENKEEYYGLWSGWLQEARTRWNRWNKGI